MSVRPHCHEPYHNQPSLRRTCSQCGGPMCFKGLRSPSVELWANIHTLVKQNIQIETAVRLGGHSLINSEPSQWEHSDFAARDELLSLSTQQVTSTMPPVLNLRLGSRSSFSVDLIRKTLTRTDNVPHCHMKPAPDTKVVNIALRVNVWCTFNVSRVGSGLSPEFCLSTHEPSSGRFSAQTCAQQPRNLRRVQVRGGAAGRGGTGRNDSCADISCFCLPLVDTAVGS